MSLATAVAQFPSLDWELPHATGAAKKKKKKERKLIKEFKMKKKYDFERAGKSCELQTTLLVAKDGKSG